MKFAGVDADTICGSGPVDTLLLSTCWGGGAVGIPDTDSGGGGGGGGGNGGAVFLGGDADYMMDTSAAPDDSAAHKLVMDAVDDDSSTKVSMDALDNLLLNSSQGSPPQGNNPGANNNFAELKPLPPFMNYTGHLSINGIPGHHYHAIAAQPHSPQSPHHPPTSIVEANNNTQVTNHNATSNNNVFKPSNTTLYYAVSTTGDQHVVSSSTMDGVTVKPEYVDYTSLLQSPEIEDIAAIIGSAIADTTVPSVVDSLSVAAAVAAAAAGGPGSGGQGTGGHGGSDDQAASRDSWMDLESWFTPSCDDAGSGNGNGGGGGATGGGSAPKIMSAESLQEFVTAGSQFVVPNSPPDTATASSTLQNLLSQSHHQHQQQQQQQQPPPPQNYPMQILKREPPTTGGYHMPLLQSRLQNGPPNGSMKPEPSWNDCPSPSSSTPYLNSKDMMMPHTTTGSPPGHVVSTTDNSLLLNGRYQHRNGGNGRTPTFGQIRGLKATGIPSPDMLNGGSLDGLAGGPTGGMFPHTTTASTTTPSSKSKSRNRSNRNKTGGGAGACGGGPGGVVYAADGAGGLLGKEKPVHRCTICNRGFLNKSNIKVHLRTHTGEKPFRCEVCGKAFRQKAHLLKHQQIHKRVGRD